MLLSVLRADRKDSASVARKLELIIDEWQADVAQQRGVEHRCASSDGAWRDAKRKLRHNKDTKDVMALVRNADGAERQQVQEFVDLIASSNGRAELIKRHGARLEREDDVQLCDTDNITVDADDVNVAHVRCQTTPLHVCYPPPGTPIVLEHLRDPASIKFNGHSGVIVGYSCDVDRYMIKLPHVEQVLRARRGNLSVTEATASDLVHATIGARGMAYDEIQSLTTRHGTAHVIALVAALIEMPSRSFSVQRDLQLICNVWAARALPAVTLRTLDAPPTSKAARSDSPETQRHRLRELRAQLPSQLATEFLAMSAAAAPMREAAVTEQTANDTPLRLAYDKPTRLVVTARGARHLMLTRRHSRATTLHHN